MKKSCLLILTALLAFISISCINQLTGTELGFDTWYYTARFLSADSTKFISLVGTDGELVSFLEDNPSVWTWDSPWRSPIYKRVKTYDDLILSIDATSGFYEDGVMINVAIYVNGKKVEEAGSVWSTTAYYDLGDAYDFFK